GRGFGTGGAATVLRPARPRPGPARSPDPPDGEHHQDHQAERDARHHDIQSEPGHVRGLVLGHHAHDHAGGHQDGADHDRYGGRPRTGGGEPPPPPPWAVASRTLLVVAVPERTAQRSHRGYRPASQMASCNHYDRHSGESPPDPIEGIVLVSPHTPL